MKEILLKRIELTNFKGQAHRVEEFTEGENFITGANATGKTTIFDAFTWLLFGKDSKGQSEEKAKIKMLDSQGNPIWNTDNSVEATFLVDGQELTLKRTYKEKWRKPQGQAEKVYDGQTTTFSWNGNEKISATEYKKRVSELIDEELFKLITDPMYFANMDVKKRREIVLSMAGEIDEEQIRSQCPELVGFEPGNVEETRNVAMSTRLRTMKERDNYPARIDEQMQSITAKQQQINELELVPMEQIQQQETTILNELKKVDEQLTNVEANVAAVMESNQERVRALNRIETYKQEKIQEATRKAQKWNEAIDDSQHKAQRIESIIQDLENQTSANNELVNQDRQTLADIQKQMSDVRNEQEPEADEAICPMCHRPLEQGDQETHKQKLHENWLATQKAKLEELKNRGDTIYQAAVQRKAKNEALEQQKAEYKQMLEETRIKATQPKKDAILPNFENDEEYKQLVANVPAEINVAAEIEETRGKAQEKRAELFQMQQANNLLKDKHAHKKMIEQDIEIAKNRIKTLESEQQEVNQVIAEQERIIYLCDLWTKTRTELLNAKVSSKFKLVKFKMFNYTQEGNPVPVCEITVNGVDYTALNTAATINAGLDIINALIEHYQAKAPIFIDNRESVTNIAAPETQIINLQVK